MPPKRSSSKANGNDTKNTNGRSKSNGDESQKSSRRILVTAGEGQTGRLIIDLLTTDDDYANKFDELTALVFSEQAKSVLEEYEAVKLVVFDPNDEDMLVKTMELVDTCLLIPPACKVRPQLRRETHICADYSDRTRRRLRASC